MRRGCSSSATHTSVSVFVRCVRVSPPLGLSYLSPIKYGFVALAKNEFTGLTFSCAPGERCAWKTGEQVLTALNFDRQRNIASQEGFLLCIAFGCLILSFFALWRSVRKL